MAAESDWQLFYADCGTECITRSVRDLKGTVRGGWNYLKSVECFDPESGV